MQALLFKKKLKMAGACIACVAGSLVRGEGRQALGGGGRRLVLVKKDDISKLIKDSDAENTKRQR